MSEDQTVRHFNLVVEPAISEFKSAARSLLDAENTDLESEARSALWRRCRTAAIELHQFADYVWAAEPSWGPGRVEEAAHVRHWLMEWARQQEGLRSEDVKNLHDVADAFKHSRLRRKSATIIGIDDVDIRSMGFGEGGVGEGPWGGGLSVIVRPLGKNRHLSAIIGNVRQIWRSAILRQT